jgi:hypothetical protein
MTPSVEELAPRSEDEVRAHLAAGKLVEGLQHMSPEYLKGIRRILTVSADTELISAPAYLRAAQHAPALNNFGSAVSIIQDELAHAHIGYRLLGDLGVDMDWLIYERPAEQFKYPYAFDIPLELFLPELHARFRSVGILASGVPMPETSAHFHDLAPFPAARRALRVLQEGKATSITGKEIPMRANCICVHSDTPGAVELAKAVRDALAPFLASGVARAAATAH